MGLVIQWELSSVYVLSLLHTFISSGKQAIFRKKNSLRGRLLLQEKTSLAQTCTRFGFTHFLEVFWKGVILDHSHPLKTKNWEKKHYNLEMKHNFLSNTHPSLIILAIQIFSGLMNQWIKDYSLKASDDYLVTSYLLPKERKIDIFPEAVLWRTKHKHVLSQIFWLLGQEKCDWNRASHGNGVVLFWASFLLLRPPQLTSQRRAQRAACAYANKTAWKVFFT